MTQIVNTKGTLESHETSTTASGTPMDEAFENISIDRSRTTHNVTVSMRKWNRPTAYGTIDESKGNVHTGSVNFSDDRTYKFW